MMNFRIIFGNHTSYTLISQPLVTSKILKKYYIQPHYQHNRKLLPVAVQNFEIRLRRRWQVNFQPDNQKNHYNSLTHVVKGGEWLGFTLRV